MPMNPIERPGFDRRVYRPPNPRTMRELRHQATLWRAGREAVKAMKSDLDRAIVDAFDDGHSYTQLREATGMGNGTLETILAKHGRLRAR